MKIFANIPDNIKNRMEHLEKLDALDRVDGTLRMQRLRQIPPVTGKYIAEKAVFAPKGEFIEIGASAAYSTLWLSLAAMERGIQITTFEILIEKQLLAEETIKITGLENVINLVKGDALEYLDQYKEIAFCFLDAEKEVYEMCYDMLIPNIVTGGILIADNAINHEHVLRPLIDKSLNDERVYAKVLSIGKGLLQCIKK